MKRRNKVNEAGANTRRESVQIADLMVEDVVTASPGDKIGDLRTLMRDRKFNALPVVDADGEPIGILTTTDLLDAPSEDSPVESVMTRDVVTIPTYARIPDAAKVMRNHKIHHLVVTNEKKIVGILSSFDILGLVAGKRFVLKEPASRPRKGGAGRRKEEGLEE